MLIRWIGAWLRAPFDALIEGWRAWRTPKPLIRYIGPDGVGWRHPPEWQEAEYPDVGQHDTWKREMRIFLLRAHASAMQGYADPGTRSVDLQAMRLAPTQVGRRHEAVGALWPMGEQLAEACRRLGFARLARAAVEPHELSDADLRTVHLAAHGAAVAEALRRKRHNDATAATWDAHQRGGPFTPDTYEANLQTFNPGDFDSKGHLPPLVPLVLCSGPMPAPPDPLIHTRRRS